MSELQEPLYQAARAYGSRAALRAIALITGASLHTFIARNRMTRLDACRVIDGIEKTAFGAGQPPPGAAIPVGEPGVTDPTGSAPLGRTGT